MEHPVRQLASAQFPSLLHEIPDPPHTLYMRGNLPPPDHKLIAVVGSRKYTPYGKGVCEHLIQGLRGAPLGIVSGLALGIDAIAHAAALDAKLYTLAIPGSGLDWDVLYPRTNHSLAHAIIQSGGGLLSEFESSMRAAPHTFPQRNRIMAGITHATLLIEAAERSGTLITARLATEYNRELLAVPGSIFSESTAGTHQFLKLGARLVTCAQDILDALDIKKNSAESADPENLTEHERMIFQLLAQPTSREDALRILNMSATNFSIAITTLEIRGLVCEELGFLRRK